MALFARWQQLESADVEHDYAAAAQRKARP